MPTRADKRRAVALALGMRPTMIEGAIAEHCGVHVDLVRDARREMESGGRIPTTCRRTGRMIAECCGISSNFVGDLRRQVSSDDTSSAVQVSQIVTPGQRTGRDGKSYPVPPPPSGIIS